MDENRKSAVADAGPGVPVFPLPFFQKAFLPESNATADQMQSIIADVKASSVWSATDSKWAAYVKPPTEHVGVETVVFSELSTVMGQIATSAAKVLSASESGGSSKTTLSEFSMRPETSVWAEVFNSSYKPDANFILNKSRGYEGETPANATAPLVYDLVDLQEFKKGDNKKDFNNVRPFAFFYFFVADTDSSRMLQSYWVTPPTYSLLIPAGALFLVSLSRTSIHDCGSSPDPILLSPNRSTLSQCVPVHECHMST